MTWLISGLLGAATGITLYGVVRLRDVLAQMVGTRFGRHAYYGIWLGALVMMVLLANVGLQLLHLYIGSIQAPVNVLALQLSFAALTLFSGGGLTWLRSRHCC